MSLQREILSPVTTAGLLYEKKQGPVICQNCHVKFTPKYKGQHLCSKKCYYLYQKGKPTKNKVGFNVGKTKSCPKCGELITYEDRYSMVRHMGSKHNPMKNPETLKKNNPVSHFKSLNENYKNGIFPENWFEIEKLGKQHADN